MESSNPDTQKPALGFSRSTTNFQNKSQMKFVRRKMNNQKSLGQLSPFQVQNSSEAKMAVKTCMTTGDETDKWSDQMKSVDVVKPRLQFKDYEKSMDNLFNIMDTTEQKPAKCSNSTQTGPLLLSKEELLNQMKLVLGCNFILVDLNSSSSKSDLSKGLFLAAKDELKKSKLGFLGNLSEQNLALKVQELHDRQINTLLDRIAKLQSQLAADVDFQSSVSSKVNEDETRGKHKMDYQTLLKSFQGTCQELSNEVSSQVIEEKWDKTTKIKPNRYLQTLDSIISLSSLECEPSAFQIQETQIDCASQMQTINNQAYLRKAFQKTLTLSQKEEKEKMLIETNRGALTKREEAILDKPVDIESSMYCSNTSNRNREVSVFNKSANGYFLEDVATNSQNNKQQKRIPEKTPESDSENVQDSVVILDVQSSRFGSGWSTNRDANQLKIGQSWSGFQQNQQQSRQSMLNLYNKKHKSLSVHQLPLQDATRKPASTYQQIMVSSKKRMNRSSYQSKSVLSDDSETMQISSFCHNRSAMLAKSPFEKTPNMVKIDNKSQVNFTDESLINDYASFV